MVWCGCPPGLWALSRLLLLLPLRGRHAGRLQHESPPRCPQCPAVPSSARVSLLCSLLWVECQRQGSGTAPMGTAPVQGCACCTSALQALCCLLVTALGDAGWAVVSAGVWSLLLPLQPPVRTACGRGRDGDSPRGRSPGGSKSAGCVWCAAWADPHFRSGYSKKRWYERHRKNCAWAGTLGFPLNSDASGRGGLIQPLRSGGHAWAEMGRGLLGDLGLPAARATYHPGWAPRSSQQVAVGRHGSPKHAGLGHGWWQGPWCWWGLHTAQRGLSSLTTKHRHQPEFPPPGRLQTRSG